jgi:CheY-like chemotaxis protein
MSEAMTMPPLTDAPTKRTPTVYFIDDSATMREVIKIAFRKESINIVACADANAALSQFEQNPPDAVITDVIMPDQDGYSVCTRIKQHAEYGNVPVILMSGVVNKTVADKAIAVKADELIRKPFQPQELISRVKSLLGAKIPSPAAPERPVATTSLSSLFAPPPPVVAAPPVQAPPPPPPPTNPPESIWPRALAEAFAPPRTPAAPPATPMPTPPAAVPPAATPSAVPPFATPSASAPSAFAGASTPPQTRSAAASSDLTRLRGEILRLELLVKKLQTELQIERQYNQALEQHLRNLTSAEE